jgi:hypothetical protein
LGLETDWNSCIRLSSEKGLIHDDDESDMKGHLPTGIENIRHHLLNVDDVPLHVSLFAKCNAHSIQEMTKIFQEYAEVVCVMGNTLNLANMMTFALVSAMILREKGYVSSFHDEDQSLIGGSFYWFLSCSYIISSGFYLFDDTRIFFKTFLAETGFGSCLCSTEYLTMFFHHVSR